MQTIHLSRLMRFSWEVQRRRRSNRSKALTAAWAIFLNEDLAVWHLVQKHRTRRNNGNSHSSHIALFTY